MVVVAATFALLAGLLHVGIFVAESILWTRPQVWRGFGLRDQAAADQARFFTFNQGFYNLFLAVGALVGAIVVLADRQVVGWTLLVFACGSMVAAATALLTGGGRGYLRPACVQAAFPSVALLAALVVALQS